MKHQKLFVVSILASWISSIALASEKNWWEKIYIGADAQTRRMDFKGGFGDNLLAHTSPQGNIYAGVKFNEWAGVEMGYEATRTRTRLTTLTTGDISLGAPIEANMSPAVFKSVQKVRGPHLDVVGFYTPNERYPVQFLGSLGISMLKGVFERHTLQLGSTPMSTIRKLIDHKTVLRLSGGIQYMYDEHFSIRATVGWVNTGKIIILANDGVSSTVTPAIKLKNSGVCGLGILWTF